MLTTLALQVQLRGLWSHHRWVTATRPIKESPSSDISRASPSWAKTNKKTFVETGWRNKRLRVDVSPGEESLFPHLFRPSGFSGSLQQPSWSSGSELDRALALCSIKGRDRQEGVAGWRLRRLGAQKGTLYHPKSRIRHCEAGSFQWCVIFISVTVAYFL